MYVFGHTAGTVTWKSNKQNSLTKNKKLKHLTFIKFECWHCKSDTWTLLQRARKVKIEKKKSKSKKKEKKTKIISGTLSGPILRSTSAFFQRFRLNPILLPVENDPFPTLGIKVGKKGIGMYLIIEKNSSVFLLMFCY